MNVDELVDVFERLTVERNRLWLKNLEVSRLASTYAARNAELLSALIALDALVIREYEGSDLKERVDAAITNAEGRE